MKKFLLSASLFFAIIISAKAQKAATEIGVAAELGFPIGNFSDDFKTGFGGSVKGMLGVTKDGQVTFTSGYSSYQAKGSTSDTKASINIIPILAGYRQNFNGFYLEPQIGYGDYIARVKFMGISASSSKGAFTYAAGAGYAKNGLEFGVRYQSGKIEGDNISLIGVHAGYNFSFKSRDSKK